MVTEYEAVRLAKENDLAGLRALVELYQQESIRLAALIVQDRQLAEDVVSDSFLKAFERIEQFDVNRQFFPWFRRILVNHALKKIDHRKRFISLDVFTGREADNTNILNQLGSLPDPSDTLEEAEVKAAIRAAIESLSPKQRAVVVLRYYFDLSEAEIAETLHIPRGTVKSRAAAGIGRLTGLLSGLRSLLPGLF